MTFKDFFDNNTSIMLCINPKDGNIIYANKVAYNFYGYLNLIGMNIINIQLDPNIKFDEKENLIINHQTANNTIKKVDIHISNVKIKDKDLYLLTIYDITNNFTQNEKNNIDLDELFLLKKTNDLFFQNSKFGIAKIDINGKFIDINDKFCKILNHKKNDLLQKDYIEITYSNDLIKCREGLDKLLSNKIKKFDTKVRFIKNNEHKILCFLSLSSVFNSNGEFSFFIAMINNIETKTNLNERYNSLINNMTNGVIILEPSLESKLLKIIQINKVALEMDCLSSIDILGKDILDIFPNIKNNGLLSVINRVIETGISESTPLTFYNDNISGWRENYIYKLSTGEIVLLYKDVTTRKQLEETLKKDQKLKKDILDNLPDMVWLKDKQGIYLSCNNKFEKYFGHKEKDIIGLTDYDFVNPLTAQVFRNNDTIAIASESSRINEEWITYPNGKRVLLNTTKIPLKNSEDNLIGVLGIGRDITTQRENEDNLNLYANVFKYSKEGILITNKEGYIIDVNDAFTSITGYSKEDALGNKPSILKSNYHNKKFYKYMWDDIKTLGYWSGEITNKRKNGNYFNELLTISVIKDKKGKDKYYVALFNDISLIKENEKTLEKLAHYDTLTSLPNRVLLDDRIHQCIYNSRRTNTTFALAFLDLDGFKEVNDTYGHEVGDQLLIHVSSILLNTLRETDTVSRHGGDEFVLILTNIVQNKDVEDFFNKILLNIANPFKINNNIIKVSASIGIITYDDTKKYTPDMLLKKADDAMYHAKKMGKNRFMITS